MEPEQRWKVEGVLAVAALQQIFDRNCVKGGVERCRDGLPGEIAGGLAGLEVLGEIWESGAVQDCGERFNAAVEFCHSDRGAGESGSLEQAG